MYHPIVTKNPRDVLMDTFSAVRNSHRSYPRTAAKLANALNNFFFTQYAGAIERKLIQNNRGEHVFAGIRYDGYLLHSAGNVFKVNNGSAQHSVDNMTFIADIPPIKHIAAGEHFAVFLDTTGTVWLRDEGSAKTTPDGSKRERILLNDIKRTIKPVQITGIPLIKDAVACKEHCMLLDEQGGVWVFGINDNAQLGLNSSFTAITQPTRLANLPAIIHFSTEPTFSFFVDNKNVLWGCGAISDSGMVPNAKGQAHGCLVTLPTQVDQINYPGINRKKKYLDPTGNIWTIAGQDWTYSHSKQIKLRSGISPIQSQFPKSLLYNQAVITIADYPDVMMAFNTEMSRYEQMLISAVIDGIISDVTYISTVPELIRLNWRYYEHLGLFLAPILTLNSQAIMVLINEIKKNLVATKNSFMKFLVPLLETYHYLIMHHEQDDKIIKQDQTYRVEDFIDLLVKLGSKKISNHAELAAHLESTGETRELASRKIDAGFFSFNIPRKSTQYFDTRQKLLTVSLNQSSDIKDLHVWAEIFIDAFLKYKSSDQATNSFLIRYITQNISVKLTMPNLQLPGLH